jgi:hypothetical protein
MNRIYRWVIATGSGETYAARCDAAGRLLEASGPASYRDVCNTSPECWLANAGPDGRADAAWLEENGWSVRD